MIFLNRIIWPAVCDTRPDRGPAAALHLLLPGTGHASCGTAFCGVNTHWEAQGLWDRPGWRADVRFEFIDQDQPRHGSGKVAVGELHRHHDAVRTLNRNWPV